MLKPVRLSSGGLFLYLLIMPTEIDLEALNDICVNVVLSYADSQPLLYNLLGVLYSTGLRANEVLETDRWSSYDNDYYIVQLEKGQQTRLIDKNLFNDQIAPYYNNQSSLGVYTYSSVRYSAAQASPIIKFGNNTNRTVLHMFRYRFIKDLWDSGLTISQIKDVTKQTSTATVEIYTSDKIYQYP